MRFKTANPGGNGLAAFPARRPGRTAAVPALRERLRRLRAVVRALGLAGLLAALTAALLAAAGAATAPAVQQEPLPVMPAGMAPFDFQQWH
ncbi:hypothetical protein LLG90_15990 [Aromatoleum toluclasticum]|uniref:hypothetical protein n=1 Tax=Aromatoleum toluclasticum TaxID=92003 RepID=UPI001D189EB7|nr:hypothetical protein [Aromatoleum toluclasticum]MCC4116855.1 hypothetical protein [Aromatoleum toluclasticum]